jgi:hypothetical protein
MKKVIKLTENDLTRIVKRVLMEGMGDIQTCLTKAFGSAPDSCLALINGSIPKPGETPKMPNPTDPNLIACATAIGMDMVDIMLKLPDLYSCITGDNSGGGKPKGPSGSVNLQSFKDFIKSPDGWGADAPSDDNAYAEITPGSKYKVNDGGDYVYNFINGEFVFQQ